mgnify:CR=1 FL=1
MAQERIEIKFIATGNVPLVKAIRELQKGSESVETISTKVDRLTDMVTKFDAYHLTREKVQQLLIDKLREDLYALLSKKPWYVRLWKFLTGWL